MIGRQSKDSREQRTISEAKELLEKVSFSASHGAYCKGRNLAVAVNPSYNDDETINILISCIPFAHLQVDWSPFFVTVSSSDLESPLKTVPLDNRGQAVFPRMAAGRYSLSMWEHVDDERIMSRIQHDSPPAPPAATLPCIFRSLFTDIEVFVPEFRPEPCLLFQTTDTGLAGLPIRIVAVSRDTYTVIRQKKIILAPPADGNPEILQARMYLPADLPTPYSLLFQLACS